MWWEEKESQKEKRNKKYIHKWINKQTSQWIHKHKLDDPLLLKCICITQHAQLAQDPWHWPTLSRALYSVLSVNPSQFDKGQLWDRSHERLYAVSHMERRRKTCESRVGSGAAIWILHWDEPEGFLFVFVLSFLQVLCYSYNLSHDL